MINISIENYQFLFWHRKKILKSELWYFCGKQTNKIPWFQILCVLTHTKFQKVEFCLSVFHRNITNLILIFFFHAKIETYSFHLIYLITYKYFLILAAELAKIKFLKSRKKPTLSDVLNFASLIFAICVWDIPPAL